MDLKTFVAESIRQICEGIVEAQEATKKTGAIISPRCNFENGNGVSIVYDAGNIKKITAIHFDVALSATESDERNAEGSKRAGLQIASVKLGAEYSSGNNTASHQEQSSISRIQFDIPVLWPMLSGAEAGQGLKDISWDAS